MLYSIARKFLFKLDAEQAHDVVINMFKSPAATAVKGLYGAKVADKPVNVMGIDFPNPVGLAAGLDKNGECIRGFSALGFGFVEVGTVTPRPQPGNDKPRIFRLPEADAIINRMGFNNHGVDYLVERVRKAKQAGFNGVLGINIGKNKDTAEENAKDDYIHCMRKVYEYADYITVNISSPNTPGLRALQYGDALNELLAALKAEQAELSKKHGKYIPLAVKIAPDLTAEEVQGIADCLMTNEIDAVIATNTTLSREGVENLEHGGEMGGLSGIPVQEKSLEVIKLLSERLDGKMPIIGVGGINSATAAKAKLAAGASLVQVYTGFIYEGPELIKRIVDEL
ncbi:quinone-dependent dihydroorotate dehydrogenase [Thalassotalea sp. PS06]|uniref:quinone-dependent dihydroorotate dehydrogenase n=1 Tax=Thalassotalea sp. PS06 TaxID=2594005 RepID=UPI001163899D|nr:quinone-dependent dihydroorotate dehydrogenase [Thalassotalea sp. PS06]QDP01168.1 quinone-dependent dihydroorotate dehydrogenase [Thalassotalea sp. PS06]